MPVYFFVFASHTYPSFVRFCAAVENKSNILASSLPFTTSATTWCSSDLIDFVSSPPDFGCSHYSPLLTKEHSTVERHRNLARLRNMVKSIPDLCRLNISPRILGIDDAPFQTRPRVRGSEVHAVGVVTSLDRFEGMLYCGGIEQDGLNAGQRLTDAILASKFHEQIHAVFVDGVTMGGLNIVNIDELAKAISRPVVAVMRSHPNIEKMLDAIAKLPDKEERTARIRAAGPIHEIRGWIFQYRYPSPSLETVDAKSSVAPEDVAMLLDKCTPTGGQKIPECLRIAHLIGAAIKTGQSSSSA